jgi:hypothetical protein
MCISLCFALIYLQNDEQEWNVFLFHHPLFHLLKSRFRNFHFEVMIITYVGEIWHWYDSINFRASFSLSATNCIRFNYTHRPTFTQCTILNFATNITFAVFVVVSDKHSARTCCV